MSPIVYWLRASGVLDGELVLELLAQAIQHPLRAVTVISSWLNVQWRTTDSKLSLSSHRMIEVPLACLGNSVGLYSEAV